ncbi:hypothetical protein H072_7686 [Dactylellina haptotyla CBS 200.50]|uniref:Large ribosomal subunit protein bL21m n=1 Tax=Dactylellina haptotyla (strain CBS 200.50) TaxID=1284197 RepID=S8BGU7_DACHA|nr:hypothetical protein H072_7686 [Dactylellina haptotyla CBS 200.50]
MTFLPTLTRRVLLRESSIASRSLSIPTLSASRILLPSPYHIRHASTTPAEPQSASPLPTIVESTPTKETTTPPPSISTELANLKQLHTALRHQPPWYTTVHLHNVPYLVTLGDRITLPSVLYGPPSPTNPYNKPLQPGDIVRLTHASTLGSREYTIKGTPYIDERLFTCKAVVVELTSEPMRKKEKTKRRQRRVKTVKSKHRYTVLRICELEVNDLPSGLEAEALAAGQTGEAEAVKEVA